MELQNLLREYGIDYVQDKYNFFIRRHSKYPNLFSVKYGREPDWSQIVVRQARGIIFDENDNFKIIAYPYDKFFNFYQTEAALINWSEAKVSKKEDGTMICLYNYNDEWMVSTPGSPDAAGSSYVTTNKSFSEVFFDTWKELGYKMPVSKNFCYMFELMTPYNIVVVPHKTKSIVFHGMRDLRTLQEADPVSAPQKWQKPKYYDYSSLIEVIEAAKKLDPSKQEGFVVCDKSFKRIKVKSPKYMEIASRSKSPKQFVRLILDDDTEFFADTPHLDKEFKEYLNTYNSLCKRLDAQYKNLPETKSIKEFASVVKDLDLNHVYFALKRGAANNADEHLRSLLPSVLLKIIKKELKNN